MLGKLWNWFIGPDVISRKEKLPYDYVLNLYRYMQVDKPQIDKVELEYIFSQAEVRIGPLSRRHIFVPPKLNLLKIFFALQHYNEQIIKLAQDFGDEVWQRENCFILTKPGFIVVQPEIDGFNLTYQEQKELLEEEKRQLISAEHISWLFAVWAELYKEAYPLNGFSVRCLNCLAGSDLCLIASNKPNRGYMVSQWHKGQGHRNLGVIHFDFIPLEQII